MDRVDEAKSVIQTVNPDADINSVINEIVQSIDKEVFAHGIVLFKKPFFRLVLIGIAVGMFNQFTGINVIMYYAPSIFKSGSIFL